MNSKLIRDGYVNIIDHKDLDITPKTDVEKLHLILDKIKEEATEFLESNQRDPKELGDLMEVIVGWGAMNGFSLDLINAQRKDKLKKYGGFENFVVLKNITNEVDCPLEEHN